MPDPDVTALSHDIRELAKSHGVALDRLELQASELSHLRGQVVTLEQERDREKVLRLKAEAHSRDVDTRTGDELVAQEFKRQMSLRIQRYRASAAILRADYPEHEGGELLLEAAEDLEQLQKQIEHLKAELRRKGHDA